MMSYLQYIVSWRHISDINPLTVYVCCIEIMTAWAQALKSHSSYKHSFLTTVSLPRNQPATTAQTTDIIHKDILRMSINPPEHFLVDFTGEWDGFGWGKYQTEEVRKNGQHHHVEMWCLVKYLLISQQVKALDNLM